MAGRTLHDYSKIKHAYVTEPEMPSTRQLATRFGVSFSAVAARARKEDWRSLRTALYARRETLTFKLTADRQAEKLARIHEDALDVVHAAILKMGADLVDRWTTDPATGKRQFVPGNRVTASDLVKLIDTLQLLTGGPTTITRSEDLSLGLTGDLGELPPDLLRGLLAVARSKGAGGEPVVRSPLPRIARAKPVN